MKYSRKVRQYLRGRERYFHTLCKTYCQLIGRVSLGFQLIRRSLKVNETITYAWMLWKGENEEEIIDKALHLALQCGLFLSDSTYQSQVCGRNGSLSVCACVRGYAYVCVYNHANENNYISPSGIH